MFIHKLGLIITTEQNREIVKPTDYTLQLYPVYKENGDRDLFFPNVIKKHVLNVLYFFSRHLHLHPKKHQGIVPSRKQIVSIAAV